MPSVVTLLTGVYLITIIAIVVFLLFMVSRSVKALEKIADTYVKKNGSV